MAANLVAAGYMTLIHQRGGVDVRNDFKLLKFGESFFENLVNGFQMKITLNPNAVGILNDTALIIQN